MLSEPQTPEGKINVLQPNAPKKPNKMTTISGDNLIIAKKLKF